MGDTATPLPPHLILELLVQLAVVLFASRTLAELARRLGQPSVVGELVAGVLLGPTVLGALAPKFQMMVFPPHEMSFLVLEAISWLGMVLLLFLIGAETDVRDLARLGKASFLVAFLGLVIPFAVGLGLGEMLSETLIPKTTTRHIMALFVATAFTISSMAVLAKILHDLGLAKRDVGAVTLGASVLDDTVGWMILAVIMSLADPTPGPIGPQLVKTLASVLGFLLGARLLVFPLLKRATHFVDDNFKTPGSDVALYSAFAFAFAAITDKLGIHAVFGAFVAGTLVRQVPRLRHEALERLEAVTGSVLSPIFFAFVGLKLKLSDTSSLGLAALVLALALGTKMLGCSLGALLGGLPFRSALVVGSGLSARGGMGIVVAVVGLSAGILSPTLYSVLVIMAIGTSLMAPVLLRWFGKDLPLEEHEKKRLAEEAARRIIDLRAPKVLVATGGGAKSPAAVALAARFCKREGATLTLAHVESPGRITPLTPEHVDLLKRVAAAEGASLVFSKLSHQDVAEGLLAEAKGKDIIFLAAPRQPRALEEPPIGRLVREASCHAVVLFPKRVETGAPSSGRHAIATVDGFKKVLVPTDGSDFTRAALELALAYARLGEATVAIVHVVPPSQTETRTRIARYVTGAEGETVRKTLHASLAQTLEEATRPVEIHAMTGPDPIRAVDAHAKADGYDLVVLGAERRPTGVHIFGGQGPDALIGSAYAVAVVVPSL